MNETSNMTHREAFRLTGTLSPERIEQVLNALEDPIDEATIRRVVAAYPSTGELVSIHNQLCSLLDPRMPLLEQLGEVILRNEQNAAAAVSELRGVLSAIEGGGV